MDKPRNLEIKSIIGATQHEDFLEFEVIQVDSDGNRYVSCLRVRNHYIGLFNRVLKKVSPVPIPGAFAARHTTPKKPGPRLGPGLSVQYFEPRGDQNELSKAVEKAPRITARAPTKICDESG